MQFGPCPTSSDIKAKNGSFKECFLCSTIMCQLHISWSCLLKRLVKKKFNILSFHCHRRYVIAICNIVFPQWLTETIKYIKATILKVKVDFLRHLRSCLGVLRKWLLGIDIQCFQSNEIFYCSFHFQTTCLGSNNSTGILV